GEGDLAGVDDDDVVAVIDMRGKGRLVLATQAVGDDGGEATDDEAFRVDQHPFLRHLRRLLRKGFHRFLFHSDLPRRIGQEGVSCCFDCRVSRQNQTTASKDRSSRRLIGQGVYAVKRKFHAREDIYLYILHSYKSGI